ncbi:DUF6308 family protein [Promicromonospora thailandica]|uniref:DUF6308 family protein n=1 Tax=Promicromonospora thailandica TaxID=765201 RepID=UPI0020A4C7B7|nr:DUF6308 family protein [Promicromonospora thailandica]
MTADPQSPGVPTILAHAELAFALLRDYYTGTLQSGRPAFTGARFETLGGPWNDRVHAGEITAGDLAAVSCLSVNVPGSAAVRVLETQAAEIREHLRDMPGPDVPLWEVPDTEIVKGSAASQLWWLLRDGKDGLGRTTTSKLMARKRANLVPVYDSVVGNVLGLRNATGHWELMRTLMVTEVNGQLLHQYLDAMTTDAGLAPLVTPLRAFDAVVWYAHTSNSRVRERAQRIADKTGQSDALSPLDNAAPDRSR